MSITLNREISASDLRGETSDVLNSVAYTHSRVGITRHGKVAAVLVSVEDVELLERFEEAADVRAYEEAVANDDGVRHDLEDVLAELGL